MKIFDNFSAIFLKLSSDSESGGSTTDLKKILKNINWLAFESILRNVVNLIIYAWVARYLGANDFGLMNYALAFSTLFSILATFGLDPIIIRNIVSKPENTNKYLGTAFLLRTITAFLTLAIAFIAIILKDPGQSEIHLYVMIFTLVYVFKIFDITDLWFQSQVLSKYSVYARAFAFFIITLFKIYLILSGASLLMFVLVVLAEQVITALMLVFLYWKKSSVKFREWKVDKDILVELIKDGLPMLLGGFAAVIYMKIDQIMVADLVSVEELGYYSSAVKLSEAWFFIPNIIASSVFPAILNAKRKSEKLYNERLQTLYNIMTIIPFAISLAISVFAPIIIQILYGAEYMPAAQILSVHIWSNVFIFTSAIAAKWVIAENYLKNALMRTVTGAILNIALNQIFISKWGATGAAISTILSYAYAGYISFLFVPKTRIAFWMQTRAFNFFRTIKELLAKKFVL